MIRTPNSKDLQHIRSAWVCPQNCAWISVCSMLECAMMIESQTLQVYYFVSFMSIAIEHMISAPKKLHKFAIQPRSICFLHMCAINHMMGFKFVERKFWDYFFWWQMVGCKKSQIQIQVFNQLYIEQVGKGNMPSTKHMPIIKHFQIFMVSCLFGAMERVMGVPR